MSNLNHFLVSQSEIIIFHIAHLKRLKQEPWVIDRQKTLRAYWDDVFDKLEQLNLHTDTQEPYTTQRITSRKKQVLFNPLNSKAVLWIH
jgi:hypothetical protein